MSEQRRQSELDQFQDSLIRAEHVYKCDTGRSPDKLVLGKKEWAEYNGMMTILISQGLLHRQPGGPAKMQWRGMDVILSSMDSLLIAAESAAKP